MYDYVIIELCKDSFSTSEMQFGFKEKHSTTMCTVILREVIQNQGWCQVQYLYLVLVLKYIFIST